MRFALVATFLLLASSSGWAFETGKDFLKECEPSANKPFAQMTETEQLMAMSCGGYIRGFVGAIRVTEARMKTAIVCSPDSVEIGQALRLTVKWMHQHTGELNRPAVQLIFSALVDSFPCSEEQPDDDDSGGGQDQLSL